MSQIRPNLTPSTQGLPAFHRTPTQLAYGFQLQTLSQIKKAIINQEPYEIYPEWEILDPPFQPTWYYMKTWPYLNKRFTEVI